MKWGFIKSPELCVIEGSLCLAVFCRRMNFASISSISYTFCAHTPHIQRGWNKWRHLTVLHWSNKLLNTEICMSINCFFLNQLHRFWFGKVQDYRAQLCSLWSLLEGMGCCVLKPLGCCDLAVPQVEERDVTMTCSSVSALFSSSPALFISGSWIWFCHQLWCRRVVAVKCCPVSRAVVQAQSRLCSLAMQCIFEPTSRVSR